MIIASSSIGMDSARKYTSVSQDSIYSVSGRLYPFSNQLFQELDNNSATVDDDLHEPGEDKAGLARQQFNDIFEQMKTKALNSTNGSSLIDEMEEVRLKCIQYLLYLLFGIKSDDDCLNSKQLVKEGSSEGNSSINVITSTTTGMYAEQEETSFSTTGTVMTADGREIEFNLNLSMSRSFAQYYEQTITSISAFTDPLVINLDSPIAQMSDISIMFDLDCDGTSEEISGLSSSSGFIALDLNDDGIINDGSELFGTQSQDGFADLAKYDSDGNGFIDEADEIFDKLKICVFDEKGNQTLYSLADKGVGALYLDSVSTDFSLNDSLTNQTNARIRRTGIFLYENGGIGTLQHLDFAQ